MASFGISISAENIVCGDEERLRGIVAHVVDELRWELCQIVDTEPPEDNDSLPSDYEVIDFRATVHDYDRPVNPS
jgi:hypothetical protein